MYKVDGVTIAKTAYSDAKGDYKISLIPDDYIIYTPNGPVRKKINVFTIADGETTTLNLVINTGICSEGLPPESFDVGVDIMSFRTNNSINLQGSTVE